MPYFSNATAWKYVTIVGRIESRLQLRESFYLSLCRFLFVFSLLRLPLKAYKHTLTRSKYFFVAFVIVIAIDFSICWMLNGHSLVLLDRWWYTAANFQKPRLCSRFHQRFIILSVDRFISYNLLFTIPFNGDDSKPDEMRWRNKSQCFFKRNRIWITKSVVLRPNLP